MSAPTIGASSMISGDLMPGPNDPPITIEDMIVRNKVLTLDDARLVLGKTEPLAFVDFETGDHVSFRVEEGWNEDIETKHGTDPVAVFANVSRGGATQREFQLTLDAVHQATTSFGMGKGYVDKSPAFLTEEAMRWWFQTGMDREFRLHVIGEDQLGMALTRPSVEPFSNLNLLDALLERIEELHPGMSIYVDRNKMSHSLRLTHLQLILPELSRTMEGTGEVDDRWWGGVQIINSMTAEKPTSADGFLLRQRCTNGMVTVAPSDPTWNRKKMGQDEGSMLEWAKRSVDEIFENLDHSWDQIQATVNQPVEDLETYVGDLFENYRIPVPARRRILDFLATDDEAVSVYQITNAITEAANGDVVPSQQQLLMRAGGDLAHHADRCDSCHRMLPEGFEPSHDEG